MIVLLQANWFDGAKLHEKGRIDYVGNRDDLPKSALVLSEDGTLPVASNSPKAGFGAKPIEEQIMDLAGMGPTHQIILSADAPVALSEDEQDEQDAQDLEKRKAAAQARKDAREDAIDALRKETEAGIAAANEAFAKIEPSIDPIAAVAETGPETPTETPTPAPEPLPAAHGSSGEDPIAPTVVVVDKTADVQEKNESIDPFKTAKKK